MCHGAGLHAWQLPLVAHSPYRLFRTCQGLLCLSLPMRGLSMSGRADAILKGSLCRVGAVRAACGKEETGWPGASAKQEEGGSAAPMSG